MQRNNKKIDAMAGDERTVAVRITKSSVPNSNYWQEAPRKSRNISDSKLERFYYSSPDNMENTEKNFRRFGIKFWAFLIVPIFTIVIGAYFTVQAVGNDDSPEIFSQDEIKNGFGKNFSSNLSNQTAQAPKANPQTAQVNNSPESPAEDIKQENAVLPDETKPVDEPAEESFTFAVLGDTQSHNPENSAGNFQKAVKEMKKLSPDKVFAVGDLVSSCDNSDCEGKFNAWKNILGSLSSKTYAVQGNHDRTDGEKSDKIWQKVFDFPTNGPGGFSELAYSLDHKNSHFVFLASDNPEEHIVNSEQRDWLEKDLAGNKKTNTFVFFHEPAYPVSSKIGESLDDKGKDRDALWKILDAHNVSAVFSGHEHINSRRKINSSVFSGAKNSIYQFIVGNTDAFDHDEPKVGLAEYSYRGSHFMLMKVKGKSYTAKVYSADGKELNSFDFSK